MDWKALKSQVQKRTSQISSQFEAFSTVTSNSITEAWNSEEAIEFRQRIHQEAEGFGDWAKESAAISANKIERVWNAEEAIEFRRRIHQEVEELGDRTKEVAVLSADKIEKIWNSECSVRLRGTSKNAICVITGIQAVHARRNSIRTREEADLLKADIESTNEAMREDLNELLEEFGRFRVNALSATVGRFLHCLEKMKQSAKNKEYKFLSEIRHRLKCCMRILFLFICAMSFASCSNQELNLDKFFSRLNARELNEASTYIHIGDHACLYFFAEMLGKSPDLFFELHSKQFISVDGKEAIVADIECVNMTPFFRNYMASLNILQDDGFIHDTIYVSKTAEGKKLSFRWANISGGNLKMASILDPDVSAMNIREHNSTNSRIIGKLSQGSSIVIDDYSNDPNWVRCYSLDHLCYKQEGFLYRPSLKIVNSDFFSLNLFESMGLLIAFIIFFALGILIVYGGSIVDAIVRGNGGCGGWILTSAMVIGILALIYVILEKILFELFVINLPY